MTDEQTAGEWVPEFEGQRPPFAPGNQVAVGNAGPLAHGVWSPRKVEPIAAEYLERVLADDAVPYLREPRYAPQLVAWAKAEARLVLAEQWVESMPIKKAATAPAGRTPPLEMLRKLDSAALTHRDRLGLTPMSAARLGKDVAQGRQADAATELTRMREEHERAERVLRGEVVEGD